jgi:hypothetical protein
MSRVLECGQTLSLDLEVNRVSGIWVPRATTTRDAALPPDTYSKVMHQTGKRPS